MHFLACFFFWSCRDSTDQFGAQQTTVGVHHVSTTLSVRVWLMMAAICCPILLAITSHIAISAARKNKLYIYISRPKFNGSILHKLFDNLTV